MEFGIARDIITPVQRMFLGGYGTRFNQPFSDIHDDLFVKALVLDDGSQRVVLVTFDLLMHDFSLTEKLGEHLREAHGLPAENLVVSYTHTHAGPALVGYDSGQASPEYELFLHRRAEECIDRAMTNTFAGRLEYGCVEGEWNINRRRLIDGQMRNAPNLNGNRDRRLQFLKVSDGNGACRALLLNYACHPVTLGATFSVSAEYPGRLCQLLEADLYGCTALFFQGAGGNTRPLVAAKADSQWKQCAFTDVDGMAQAMAAAVRARLLAGGLESVDLNLAVRRFVIELETEIWPRERFERLTGDGPEPESSSQEAARAVLARWDDGDNIVPLHATLVRLDDRHYLASLCGEVCVEVAQEVEKLFGDRRLLFFGYGDGTAYIPDDSLIDEGGYEVDGSVVEFGLKGPFKQGINEKLRASFDAALASLPA